MERKYDYSPNFNPYIGMDQNQMYQEDYMAQQMMSPAMQYEQMYMYYKYLTQQMEYRIKCLEYEKMSNMNNTNRQ